MFSIVLSDLAKKQISKLNKVARIRIVSTLKRCRIRPYSHMKKMVGSPYFSLRVGDYRVILDVQNKELVIFVIEMGHRRNIYKR